MTALRFLLGTPFLILALNVPAMAQERPTNDTGVVKTERKTRVRLGGVMVGAGYSRFSGYPFFPGYYGGWPYYWGYYDPFWYSPWLYPGFTAYGPNKGEVKLQTLPRSAEVLIDGAYAGKVQDLKTMWLSPGAYQVEVREGTQTVFQRRIYVLSGKTLKLAAAPPENKP